MKSAPSWILQSKLYFVCPWKYQDYLKPLRHLPINIWSATNTFIWLIPVVTSTKLPLMRQIFLICATGENISRTKQDMKNR
jgi:hypothetical protein